MGSPVWILIRVWMHSLGQPAQGQCALGRGRRGDRIARAAESHEQRIALGVDLPPAVRLEGVAH
jgi:hypothetical protein